MDDVQDGVTRRMVRIVSEQFAIDESAVHRGTHFINDLSADSLDAVETVMEVEDEFELSIPDEDAEKIATVGDAIDYVKKLLAMA